jgi:hypothetical protein
MRILEFSTCQGISIEVGTLMHNMDFTDRHKAVTIQLGKGHRWRHIIGSIVEDDEYSSASDGDGGSYKTCLDCDSDESGKKSLRLAKVGLGLCKLVNHGDRNHNIAGCGSCIPHLSPY